MSDLQKILDHVPVGQHNPVEYVINVLNLYHNLKKFGDKGNQIGHRISKSLSDKITQIHNRNLDDTRSVFFSFSAIFDTIDEIGGNFGVDSGLAVVFGRYPDTITGDFRSEMESHGLNPDDYEGKSTVVLKYLKDLNPLMNGTEYYKDENDQHYVTNMGMLCPKMCPSEN